VDVVFYEAFEEEEEALRNCLPANITAAFTNATIQESGNSEPPASLISIRTQSRIPCRWSPLLRGILSRSSGYDHASAFRIACGTGPAWGYLPEYCSRSVAEQAMLLWTALLRRLPKQINQFSTFCRDGLTGRDCRDRNLLVVGVGHIGYQVCLLGERLDMHVQGVDIIRRHSDLVYVSIEEGLAVADVIVCAMNLTRDNRAYFNEDRLRKARAGAVFVNVARGELSPPEVLLRLLENQHLSGVALDVFEEEPELAHSLRSAKPEDRPSTRATLRLMKRPDVLLTPHNAFNTVESTARKSEQSARQVRAFLETGSFLWNVPEG